MGFQPRLLPFAMEILLDFGQMRDGSFRVFGRLVGVTGLTVGDGFFQVLDAFIQMRIFYARGLRML